MADRGGLTWERGDRVAWAMLDAKGVARAWSCTHRVFGGGQTFCSRRVPPHAVTPINKQGVGSCVRCEHMYERSESYRKERVA